MHLLIPEVILPAQSAVFYSALPSRQVETFFFFFPEEEVSGAALLALNDRMVQQLVKKVGHQAVLMDLIKKFKQKSQELMSPGETAPVTQAEAPPE